MSPFDYVVNDTIDECLPRNENEDKEFGQIGYRNE